MFRKLLLACLGLGAWAFAQQPTNPAELGTGALTQEDVGRSNVLSYGVSSSAAFDDNVQGTAGTHNVTTTIQPQVGFSINRPRLESHAYYGPAYTFSSDVASQSGTSQTVGLDFKYLFSRRLTLTLRGGFIDTSNPVDSQNAAFSVPQLNVFERPADIFSGARIHQTSGQAGADLAYRIAQFTSVGIGGSFSDSLYRSIETQASGHRDFRSKSWAAHSFVSHRLTPVISLGANYSAQNLESQQFGSATLTHSILGFTTLSLAPQVQLSFFAGPEFSQIGLGAFGTLPGPTTQAASVSYGSTLSWQGQKNGLAASFSQRVSGSIDASSGAVQARMVGFRATRQISRRTSVNLFTKYVSNSALEPGLPTSTPDSVSGGFGVSRPLTQSVSLSLLAFHQEFLAPVSFLPGGLGHNVVSMSVSYSFSKPIGR